MGIDNKSIANVSVVLDDNPQYLKQLREQAKTDGQNEEGDKRLSLTYDNHSFEPSEYYFDEGDNTITISGEMINDKGSSWVSITIPLSDIVLIDILQYSLKKLNKLKTALETLK